MTDKRPPRLVQVRGASGAGKTMLARTLMDGLGRPKKWFVPGRRQPISLTFEKPVRPLCVVGHYEVQCGGADTIKSKEEGYEVARTALRNGFDVLLEGIFLTVERDRTVQLQADGFDRHDVFINLPMDVCTESVMLRREAAGKERRELKEMKNFHRRVMRTRDRLLEAGIPPETVHVFGGPDVTLETAHVVRDAALAYVRGLFDVS